MEKQVPTIEVEIGEGKVTLYQWLTQEEEDRLNDVLLGDIDVTDEVAIQSIKRTPAKLAQANRILVESMCKSYSWEEFSQLNPELRKLILEEISKVRSKN